MRRQPAWCPKCGTEWRRQSSDRCTAFSCGRTHRKTPHRLKRVGPIPPFGMQLSGGETRMVRNRKHRPLLVRGVLLRGWIADRMRQEHARSSNW